MAGTAKKLRHHRLRSIATTKAIIKFLNVAAKMLGGDAGMSTLEAARLGYAPFGETIYRDRPAIMLERLARD